ncbi:DNA polymerase III subunit alpha [bacterium]|nr:MAG: DNA polymerase III subunit alpha [bacterium]
MSDFVHLHNHTDYSLLDSICKVDDLVEAAVNHKMPALAITDYGNMFGAAEFYSKAKSANIKPIIGMEAYLAPNRLEKSKLIYHVVLIAKNQEGYNNLMFLASQGYLDGFYYKPRIDKALIRQHAGGLIGTSACLKGEIPQRLMHGKYEEAKAIAQEYLEIFNGEFYLEMQRHGLSVDTTVNEGIMRISKELNIPVIATNDIHYMEASHAGAYDVLLCIQSGKTITDVTRPKYPGDTFYFRSSDEMKNLFKDVPAAIENTLAIAEKCDFKMEFGKSRLPQFGLPEGFQDENAYLKFLAHEGMKRKMGEETTPEMMQRLEYELDMIAKMGFPGYFLVVEDLINSAKKMGVSVGPGRGSAAGSLVSYAIGITDVDPLKYSLLFERFLNPERISMPDIDIDFDDKNRSKVIEYVIDKYGKDNVAQIITFGSMKARAVIRDVARALTIPLSDADRIAKLIPRKLDITLKEAIDEVPELKALEKNDNERMRQLIEYSQTLEGLVRQPGIHAAGVVITPDSIKKFVPVYKSAKDEISTQFDKDWVEKIGLLKMDFLGLTTLSILDDSLRHIKNNYNVDIDLNKIPMDDEKTFQLFWRGETVGIFQFESQGMTEYMKKLKPTCIDDLIAMNALYRPGPMEFIETFIARKNGKLPIDCFHPNLEPILQSTYGVIVYQEQVMQVAQILAGFSLGRADVVRRIMSKKKPDELEKIRPEWVSGATERGYTKVLAEQIFELLIPFSNYAFNKSHSAAYSILAYETAYLKAHYPAEFMAAVLSSEMANTDRISVLINACRDIGIDVLPPDVNESVAEFSVKNNTIRFGLGAVKNVGLSAIESIIRARQEHGKFKTIFDLCEFTDLRLVNKKVLESLVMSGACGSMQGHRAQLFGVIEKALNYGSKKQTQANSDQVDIFGNLSVSEKLSDSSIFVLPDTPRWTHAEELAKEKELLGFYASGHPLDKYRFEMDAFSTFRIGDGVPVQEGSEIRVGGMIADVRQIFDKKGNPMAFVKLEGFGGTMEAVVFSSVMKDCADKIKKENVVMVIGKASHRNESLNIIAENMMTMEDALERFTNRIVIQLSPEQLQNGVLDKLSEVCKTNQKPGKDKNENTCELQLLVEIPEENLTAKYKVNKFRVTPNNDFFKKLHSIIGRGRVTITTK